MSKYYSTTENPGPGDFMPLTLCLWKESKCFKSILITLVIHTHTHTNNNSKVILGGLKIFSLFLNNEILP